MLHATRNLNLNAALPVGVEHEVAGCLLAAIDPHRDVGVGRAEGEIDAEYAVVVLRLEHRRWQRGVGRLDESRHRATEVGERELVVVPWIDDHGLEEERQAIGDRERALDVERAEALVVERQERQVQRQARVDQQIAEHVRERDRVRLQERNEREREAAGRALHRRGVDREAGVGVLHDLRVEVLGDQIGAGGGSEEEGDGLEVGHRIALCGLRFAR